MENWNKLQRIASDINHMVASGTPKATVTLSFAEVEKIRQMTKEINAIAYQLYVDTPSLIPPNTTIHCQFEDT